MGAHALPVVSGHDYLTALMDNYEDFLLAGDVFVGMLPFLEETGKHEVRPSVIVTAVGPDGEPMVGMDVLVSFAGPSEDTVFCNIGRNGLCKASGPSVEVERGEPLAWTIRAPKVQDWELTYAALPLLFGGPDFDALLDALGGRGHGDSPLAIRWGYDDTPNGRTVPSFAFLSHGSGISTSPFGYRVLDIEGGQRMIALDGGALADSAFCVASVALPSDDDTIVTEPVDVAHAEVLDGSGISTSPFGMTVLFDRLGDGGFLTLDGASAAGVVSTTMDRVELHDAGHSVDVAKFD